MTSKTLALLFVAFFAMAICHAAGQDPAQGQQPKTAPAQAAKTDQNLTLSGTVDKVDLEKKSITLKNDGNGAKKSLWFGKNTAFFVNNQPGTIADVKPGSKITLQVDEYNMTLRADIPAPSSLQGTEQNPHR